MKTTTLSLIFKAKVLFRSLLGEQIWSLLQSASLAPRHRLSRLVKRETRCVIRSGPFKGMNYIQDTISGGYIPKVLGIYERELHSIVQRLPSLSLKRVINIGAADGYYAVGLCRLIPTLKVVAFEVERRGRNYVSAMAEGNGVSSQITIRSRCDIKELQSTLDQSLNSLIICDVEGYEDELLNPILIPDLHHTFVLVEIHESKNPGVSDRLRSRFELSHTIQTIWQQKRTAEDFPFENFYTRSLPREALEAAVDEGRPVLEGNAPMSWFWMTPKHFR